MNNTLFSNLIPLHLQRAWLEWSGFLWQGEATENFPESEHHWIEWLRDTGLADWQRASLQSPTFSQPSYTAFNLPDSAAVSHAGESEALATLRYHPPLSEHRREAVVLIPPCTHRASIFDISPETSLVNNLVEQGYQVVVVEWHAPAMAFQASFSQTSKMPGWQDYRKILNTLLQEISQHCSSIHLMGLCLSGVMALDLMTHADFQSSLPPIQSMTLLSTLLDYHVSSALSSLHWPPIHRALREWLHYATWIPAPLIYAMCCLLMPSPSVAGSPLSLWSQQGLHVSASLALELLDAFYAKNYLLMPDSSTGHSVLNRLNTPLYVVGGLQDRLVPVHGLFNGLYHCRPELPIRLSLFKAGHLRSFLPGRMLKGYQGDWNGESVNRFMETVPPQRTDNWLNDWKQWVNKL